MIYESILCQRAESFVTRADSSKILLLNMHLRCARLVHSCVGCWVRDVSLTVSRVGLLSAQIKQAFSDILPPCKPAALQLCPRLYNTSSNSICAGSLTSTTMQTVVAVLVYLFQP